MTSARKVAAVLLAVAVLLWVVGTLLYENARAVAQGQAQSLCTNLTLFRIDQSNGKTYADILVAGYEADLLSLGYTCENGRLTKVEVIKVTNEMLPSATDPTCTADGKLVLPVVEHAKWEKLIADKWQPAQSGSGPGTYHVRLTPDKGHKLDAVIDTSVTVKPKLTGSACTTAPKDNPYQCRTSGLNGGPTFLALDPFKLGRHSYGHPFTATTIAEARKLIREQAFCDPVWMAQKYREYVDYKMTPDEAHAKVLELIAQAKAGNHGQWNRMVNEIIAQFDKSENSFSTIDPGEYHSLGVLINTPDGVPRIVDFIVNDDRISHVLRSKVTYADGTTVVLDLRMECNLQLRTRTTEELKGAAKAPKMADVKRTREGDATTDGESRAPSTPPGTEETPAPTPVPSTPGGGSPTPTPTPGETKASAPQPGGVEQPVNNPVGTVEAHPTNKSTPLVPTQGESSNSSDGHQAEGGQQNQGGTDTNTGAPTSNG